MAGSKTVSGSQRIAYPAQNRLPGESRDIAAIPWRRSSLPQADVTPAQSPVAALIDGTLEQDTASAVLVDICNAAPGEGLEAAFELAEPSWGRHC